MGELRGNRWVQLVLGIICMIMIANLQYGWTLFVAPMDAEHHWGKASIQIAFTIFVVMETWLLPIEGWLIDRFGPRNAIIAGGAMIGLSWVGDSFATDLSELYIASAIGGLGAGFIYAVTVGNAAKWFPDKRGLAAGLTAAGFGAGSALTVIPIANWIASYGYESAFLGFGIVQGIVVLIVGPQIRAPDDLADPARNSLADPLQFTPLQVLRHPAFWVMYLMFVLVATGGLMATAQLAVIASDVGVAKTPVEIAGLTLPALTFALSLDRILNGVTRPFFGWVSDQIGRATTMFIAFSLEAAGIGLLMIYAGDPVLFVLISGLVFFAWGEIYSLFPATCTDLFGRRFATANYGLLYTAKGTAALLVPYGNVIKEATGSWSSVFLAALVFNVAAAMLAQFVLRPMTRRPRLATLMPATGALEIRTGA